MLRDDRRSHRMSTFVVILPAGRCRFFLRGGTKERNSETVSGMTFSGIQVSSPGFAGVTAGSDTTVWLCG